MPERLFDAIDVAELRDVVESELAHLGNRRTIDRRDIAGEPVERASWGDDTPCHLLDDAALMTDIAAALQVEATYLVKLALGTTIVPDDIWRLRPRDDDGNTATLQVRITGVRRWKHLSLLVTAVDDATADPTTLETTT